MFRRHISGRIHEALSDTPVVLLNGARQVGKTTLARDLATERGAHYLTLDDAATLALIAEDPNGFVRSLDEPVVIDEVQKVPDIFPAIKLAVDRRRTPGRFLLTGSADVLSLPRASESLAGRMEVLPVLPLSAGELSGVDDTFVTRLFTGRASKWKPRRDRTSLVERVVRGGYPEAITRTNAARRSAWFAAYTSTILQRDVRELARVEGLHALPNLLKLLAARSGGLLNMADVARDAALSHTTLTRYLALLEAVFLVYRLPAWSANLTSRLVKASKVHLVDTGLACHAIGADVARFKQDPALFGRFVESFVVNEVRKQLSWADPSISLFHFRTSAGMEVDLLLERPDGTIAAIEIKSRASIGPGEFSGLRGLRAHVGKRFRAGVVLYTGDQTLPFGDGLWAVPIEALWSAG